MTLQRIMFWLLVLLTPFSCAAPIEPAKADYQASFGGTSFLGLTRSSTIAEYDGTVDASGNLLDISGSNYLQYSDAIDSWTAEGGATTSANTEHCPATNTVVADTVNVTNAAGIYSRFTTTAGYTFEPSVWIKRISTSGTLRVQNPDGYIYGYLDVDMSALPDDWVKIHRGARYVTTWGVDWVPSASTRSGIYFLRTASGTVSFYACGAQVARTDRWRQGHGIYHPTTATTKPLHDLTPTNAPSEVATYLQRPDGNIWKGRSFNGSNQQYSIANHASFNIFDGNNTVTVVAASDAETNVLSRFDIATGGDMGGIRWTSVYEIKYVKADGSYTSNIVNPCGGGIRTDSKYHAMHVIRSGNNAYATCDGSVGASVDVTNAGVDLTSESFFLGGASGVYFDGNILYARIDAEALSTSQAVQEDQRLLGIGSTAGGNQFPEHTFTRATTAYQFFTNGTVAPVASGAPRVADGFLSEQLAQNVILQSQDANTTWTKVALTSVSTNIAALTTPDGTTTADGFVGNASDTQHGVKQDITTTAVTWTCSAYAQKGDKNWLYLAVEDVANVAAYYDLANCSPGAVGAAATSTASWRAGWCRATISWTGAASANQTVDVYSAEANNDNAFAGDTTTVNTNVWQVECYAAPVALSPIPTTTAAVTRNADVLTIDPFKYDDYVRVGTETMAFNFDQDPASSSVNSNASGDYDSGVYTWTGAGTRVRETTERYGTYYKFDGSSTRFSKSAETAFIPDNTGSGANFSIVMGLVPDTQPGSFGYLFGRYDTGGNDREYAIYLNNTGGCSLAISHDGTNPSFASKLTTCYTAGRPLFLAATYQFSGVADAPGATTGTSTGKLYVNDTTVVTDNTFLGPIRNGAASVFIGRSTGGSYFQGKMLFLNWYKGTVLDATTIANMYEQFKSKWLISPQMGDAGEETKLRLNFSYKLRAASASAGGDSLVEVGNNYGKSDSNSNRIACVAKTTTLVCSYWNDTTTATERTLTVTGLTQNQWNSVAYYLDYANLANSTLTVNGTAGSAVSMTGATSQNLRDATIHVGHDYTTAAGFANGWIKDVNLNSRP